MRVNTQLLEECIKNSGLKQSFIIEKLGISAQAYNKKKNNETPFRVAEVYVICDLLHITDDMKTKIFFDKEV